MTGLILAREMQLAKLQVPKRPMNIVKLVDRAELFAAYLVVEEFNRRHGTDLKVVSHDLAVAARNDRTPGLGLISPYQLRSLKPS